MVRQVLFTGLLWIGFVNHLGDGFLLVGGPQCYSCDAAYSPERCTTTKQCNEDQMCYTQKYNYSDTVEAYRLGCFSKEVCNRLGRPANDGECLRCCADNRCNRKLCSRACRNPWYGPDCLSVCGHCANGEGCEHQDGICINGCEPGFFSPFCFEELRVLGQDCHAVKLENNFTVSGIYPLDKAGKKFEAWCDMVTDGGGWVVFQRRVDDTLSFNRNWTEYKNGFGNLSGNFWWGNDKLAAITSSGSYVLRIDMEGPSGDRLFAEYQNFNVEDEKARYLVHIGAFKGNTGNRMTYVNTMPFATFDQDSLSHCAKADLSGWWYYENCEGASLNGIYNTAGQTGLTWYGSASPLKWTEMKFRSA